MAVNEIAGNIFIKVGRVDAINQWMERHSETEIIDIKFSSDSEEDMICVIYRKEDD
ncbi:hypothetical protein HXA35_15665 [Bacillus sp. A301a_S52]|jgi:hypothetical protein|nr:hypothetical protein [Bacillus sp. A301a_S52]UJW58769.1 hypothetical protein HXZ66_15750 [Bacillus sp. A116_S68]